MDKKAGSEHRHVIYQSNEKGVLYMIVVRDRPRGPRGLLRCRKAHSAFRSPVDHGVGIEVGGSRSSVLSCPSTHTGATFSVPRGSGSGSHPGILNPTVFGTPST